MIQKITVIVILCKLMTGLSFAATIELPSTGQTTCRDSIGTVLACDGTGQDGDKRKGVAWPSPRFTDNGNGTVNDNLTGLIWLKNANCFGMQTWTTSLTSAINLSSGSCGLSDNSIAGQWRLPNVTELESLVDAETRTPALPAGHPFTGVDSTGAWSSNTTASNSNSAWGVQVYYGDVFSSVKTNFCNTWPVRGGQ